MTEELVHLVRHIMAQHKDTEKFIKIYTDKADTLPI